MTCRRALPREVLDNLERTPVVGEIAGRGRGRVFVEVFGVGQREGLRGRRQGVALVRRHEGREGVDGLGIDRQARSGGPEERQSPASWKLCLFVVFQMCSGPAGTHAFQLEGQGLRRLGLGCLNDDAVGRGIRRAQRDDAATLQAAGRRSPCRSTPAWRIASYARRPRRGVRLRSCPTRGYSPA